MDAETTEPRQRDGDHLSPLLVYLRQILKGTALQTHALPMLLVTTGCGRDGPAWFSCGLAPCMAVSTNHHRDGG